MPYQVSGQAVAIKSQRLPHEAGEAGAAAGGGALVGMSAAVAVPNGAAMSNAETAIMPSEVRFMVSPSEGSSLFVCVIFAPFAVARQIEVGFYGAFPRLVAVRAQCAAQYLDLTDCAPPHPR
jgi:hypothetical protein